VIAYPDSIRNRGQRRVHRADADEEACVDYVEIVELMRLAVRIQHRGLWICAEATCAGLVGAAGNGDCSFHIDVTAGSGALGPWSRTWWRPAMPPRLT